MGRRSGRQPEAMVGLLGPLLLVVDGHEVVVPGPKRRALLALLAAAEDRAVAVDDLLTALWPGGMPRSARATLHSHVSRLRGHLGAAAPSLEGLPEAYRLSLGADGTDLGRARALLAGATGSEPAARLRLLTQARELWRGEPLTEFVDVEPLAALAVRVTELRRAIDEAYVEAALAAGEVRRAREAATAMAVADPLAEPAAALHMRVLHAAGRSAEALRAGYEFRRRLATETGLDATPALAEVEATIAGAITPRPGRPPRSGRRLRGRDSELAALTRLLATERLVTVLGPGGVGKTHLATELAHRHEPVTAVFLGTITDGGGVTQALASALDLRVTRGDPLRACAALLAAGPRLVLLDNCEHVADAVRGVVVALLDAAPMLTVLATSREPLDLPAEQRFRLGSLATDRPAGVEDLERAPAVAVFVDRARRVQPDFDPGADDLGLVTEIVRRVDGLPLAIELAAGRLASLGLGDLHARLDQALELLTAGDASLRQTIAWSYDLLPDDEQRLLRHLSAFPDGVGLATAEAVAADLGLGADAHRVLAHLVDASMLEAGGGLVVRYRMLETVRAFAQAQLEAQHESGAATERFVRWALELASWIERTADTADEARVDVVLREEFANLRTAWGLVRSAERIDDAAQLVIGICDAASWRDLTEPRAWALELAADPAIDRHPDAALLLAVAADCAWAQGDLDRADLLVRRGLDHGGQHSWRCAASQALVALSRGDLEAAIAHGTDAGARATKPEQSLAVAALAAAYSGELDHAAALNGRFAERMPSPSLASMQAYTTGEIEALAGRTEVAIDCYERAIDLARSSGSTFAEGIASVGLLTVLAGAGRTHDALAGYDDLVRYWERTGAWVQQWTTLRNLADLLASLGDETTARFLHAAADAAPDAPPVPGRGQQLPADDPAASASRAEVLEVARAAIAAQLTG